MHTSQEVPVLNPDSLVPALNPILIVDGKGLDRLKKYLATPRTYTMDYETTCVDTFYQRKARTLQIGDRNEQYIIDLLAFAETPERLWRAQGGYRRHGVLLNKRLVPERRTMVINGNLERVPAEALTPIVERVPVDSTILQPVIDVIQPSMDSDEWLKVGHMLEFEYIVSKWCLGIRAWHFYCTLTAERIIHNGAVPAMLAGFYGLGDLVRRYCGFEIDKSSQTTFDLESPLTEKQIIYCALDVRLPLAIKAAQEVKLKKAGLQWVTQIENDAIPAFGDLHLNGMYVNPVKWQKIIDGNQARLVAAVEGIDKFFLPIVGAKRLPNPEEAARLKEIWKGLQAKSQRETELSAEIRGAKSDPVKKAALIAERDKVEAMRVALIAPAKAQYAIEAGFCTKKYTDEFDKYEGQSAINFNSPDQLLAALHAGPFGLNAKNFPASNDKVMERHAKLPVIAAIREHRGVKQSLKMYGDRWIKTRDEMSTIGNPKPGFVDPDTGRIHARFNQLGADTGRLSCSNPNLLNLPHEDIIREAFESRPKFDMVSKDCSGQELRVLTQYSREPAWVHAFTHGQDIHSVSTQMIAPELWKAATVEASCAFLHKNKAKCSCPGHKKLRNDYKAVTLGIIMGLAAFSLGVQLGISTEEAQEKIDSWMQTFTHNKRAIEENQKVSYDRGEARTLAGRRRLMKQVSYEQAKAFAKDKYKDQCDQGKITKTMKSLVAAVKREGGNVSYQGCVVGATQVLEETRGLCRIEDLCGRSVRIWDGERFVSAHVVHSGPKRLVRITAAGRKVFECSPDHKFNVSGTRGNWFWKTSEEFSKQTWIKFNEEMPQWCATDIKYPEIYNARASNGKGVVIQQISDHMLLGEFVGRIASDGSIGPNKAVTLIIAEHEKAILPRLREGMLCLGGDRWAERSKQKKGDFLNGQRYQPVHSYTLADSTLANQLWLAGVKQKVPEFIMQSSDMLRGYLRGMFDGDGTVYRDGIMLTFGQIQRKEGWARQVQSCLAALGIQANVHINAGATVVRVVKREALKFQERVGFMNPVKQQKLRDLIQVGSKRGLSVIYGHAVSVRSVEVTDQWVEMYDVVDSESHKFMANGLITHNSSADFMKRAIGCGFDKEGNPYLWHILEPEFGAMLENFPYDELVTESPEPNSEAVSAAVSDAIIRAGAELVTVVPMESEGKIAKSWSK